MTVNAYLSNKIILKCNIYEEIFLSLSCKIGFVSLLERKRQCLIASPAHIFNMKVLLGKGQEVIDARQLTSDQSENGKENILIKVWIESSG